MSYIVPQKMPLRCFECGEISSSTIDGYSCSIAHRSLASEHGINVRRPDWCPLIEVPTPHGRLIDADELVRIWTGAKFYGSIKPIVDVRPTVIEAEGREE